MNVTCPKLYIGATHNRLEKLLQFVYEQLSYTILAINKINTSQLSITAPVEDVRLQILCICLFYFLFPNFFPPFCIFGLHFDLYCLLHHLIMHLFLFIHVLFSSIHIMCFISSFNISLFLCPLSLSLSLFISISLDLSLIKRLMKVQLSLLLIDQIHRSTPLSITT